MVIRNMWLAMSDSCKKSDETHGSVDECHPLVMCLFNHVLCN